ncbi:MAG: antitoxin AF2212-like protein [Anaerolineae bacterium]
MTAQTFTAVFEKGKFRPLTKFRLPISEGQQVRLTVETPESPTGVLALATQVYEGLTEDQIDEVEQIILNRQDFFGERMKS